MQTYEVFFLGLIVGIIVAFIFDYAKKRDLGKITQNIVDITKESLSSTVLQAVSQSTGEIQKFATQSLSSQGDKISQDVDGKKALIDQSIKEIRTELDKVQGMITDYDKNSLGRFKSLDEQLRNASQETQKLQETTTHLTEALKNSRVRGQWGERMADDILRLVGFVEGVNYLKQKAMEGGGSRPDFTFILPQNLKLNMDVKFPFDNYLSYLESEEETAKRDYRDRFLKDVKSRVKEITTRDYINPEENTLDFVILFIPNEQVFSFIYEEDRKIMEYSLGLHVVLVSPLTLYAILVIIRQSIDNFNLQNNISEVLSLFGGFKKQWDNFVDSFDKMGKKIDDAQSEFQRLTTTRRRKLETPLQKIDDLRSEKRIPISEVLSTEDTES